MAEKVVIAGADNGEPKFIPELKRAQIGLIVAAYNSGKKPDERMPVSEFEPDEADPQFWSDVYIKLYSRLKYDFNTGKEIRGNGENIPVKIGKHSTNVQKLRQEIWDFTTTLLANNALGDQITNPFIFEPFVGSGGIEPKPMPTEPHKVSEAIFNLHSYCKKGFH